MGRFPDWPPVWLGLFCCASYAIAQGEIWTLPNWSSLVGWVLIGSGGALMALAVLEMKRRRTTVIPHRDAEVLVSTGVFGITRNPIYLGDALVLTGVALILGDGVALVLVPVFVWVINTRFISDEEARLSAKFPEAFELYRASTRRWI